MKVKKWYQKYYKQIWMFLASFALSTLFVLFCSFSTSPIYKEYYGGDSAQFQTVGKVWSEGGLPYVDAFDHKGPIIFLANAVGYSLTGSKTGVMFIQIICLTVVLFYMVFKICQLASKKFYYGIISAIVVLVFLTIHYMDGNMTEEYCLPFIAISSYFMVRYFTNDKLKEKPAHNPVWALIYGASVGICVMTQATNALPIGAGVLAITVYLLYRREFLNILKNIGMFLAGMFIIISPFVIYFAINGALGDFIYGVIGYNSEYARNIGSWLSGATGNDFALFSVLGFTTLSSFFTAILVFYRKKYLYGSFLILSGILELGLFCSGALFPQYSMIALLQIVLLMNELVLMGKNNEAQFVKMFAIAIIAIVGFNQYTLYLHKIPDTRHATSTPPETTIDTDKLISTIPTDERNSFVAYGGNDLKDIYLRYNLLPYYKYFIIQDWHGQHSEYVKEDIKRTFADGDVKWILTDENTKNIDDTLENRYTLELKSGNYSLYKLVP